MTYHAKRLLRKLKRAQKTEDGEVFIDGRNMIVKTQCPEREGVVEVSLDGYQNSLIATLKYLNDAGYIENRTTFTQVTSTGWHLGEEQFSAFCRFIAGSVLTPIIVSVITTLITLWITTMLR